MLYLLLGLDAGSDVMSFFFLFPAFLSAFAVTALALKKSLLTLPKDQGRKYAINGELSKGKPRGGGVVFVIVYVIISLLFLPIKPEYIIIYALLIAAMLTGYLDDMSKIPWGEWKKGLLDLVICIIAVITYCNFDGEFSIYFFGGASLPLPPVLYFAIATFFLWVSINVTNCTDGVDGLSGTLAAVTMITLAVIFMFSAPENTVLCIIFAGVLLGYLLFNASPSLLLMGDAGSRAMGLFIGIMTLKTHVPLMYFLFGLMFFVDGGAGLVKLLVLRIFKTKNFMKNIRTPIHDHFRKNKGWSDTHVVTRFAIIHIVLCAASLFLYFMIVSTSLL